MSFSIQRRQLLIASAAAAGATFFDLSTILGAEDKYLGFPIGVQSYSLRAFNTLEAVRHIQGLGLHYAEFYSKHLGLNASQGQINETKALLKKHGIALNAHGVSGFSANHEANRKVFAFAKRAGIKNITANPQPNSFDSLEKLVKEFDIRICIHNHGPGALYDSIKSVQDAVKGRDPRIGACVDTGHFIRSKEDPVKAVVELGKRVFALHIKDEEKREKRSRNVVIGTGHLDLVGLFKAVKKVNFPADGSMSLEYEANPKNPIDDMKQCLVEAQKALKKVGTR